MKTAFGAKVTQNLFALITILFWAACYVGVRFASQSYTPFALTFWRFAAAALSVLCMLPFQKVKRPALRDLPLFLLSALCAYSLYCCLTALGARTVTASVSSFVMALSPVLTPVFALLFLKEHMRWNKWLSVGIGGLGVVILLFTDSSFSVEAGVLWVFAGANLFALYNIVQRILLRRYTSMEVTIYSTVLAAVTLLPFLPLSLPEIKSAPFGATLVVFLLGAASAVSYLFWSKALNLAQKTAEVTNYMFLTPIFTTIMGFIMMGEVPPVTVIFGGGLMLLGLLLTNWEPKSQSLREEAVEIPAAVLDESPALEEEAAK